MRKLLVVIHPDVTVTRMLVSEVCETGSETILKARLSAKPSHPRALSWMLEALALWQGGPAHGVFVANDKRSSCGMHFYADWFPAFESALYTIDVEPSPTRRVHRDRIQGLGSFADLRQRSLFEGR